MESAEAPVRVGEIVAGKYRVEKVLGAGAMGVVVAATHVDLLEVRAIKFLQASMVGDADSVERFLREARAAVRLKSQHVARVHDVGRLSTGAPYIVMEHLQGADLKAVLEARGVLPAAEAAAYLVQVCEALSEAHALGIVHRDLKPANLFVTHGPDGAPCVKILDFGIAKITGGPAVAGDMTATSALLGTPLYMSPEQMRGSRAVDARSDIWALGVVLYRMLTGRTPFAGSSVTEICAAVVGDAPEPPAALRPDLPPALEAVVLRCLEKSPARRFGSAAELSAALSPFTAWPGPAAAATATNQAQAAPASAPHLAAQLPAAQLPATLASASYPAVMGQAHAAPLSAPYPAAPPFDPHGGIHTTGARGPTMAMAVYPPAQPHLAPHPAAPASSPQPGSSAVHASTWTQPGRGPEAAPGPAGAAAGPARRSGGALLVAGAVLVLLGGGGAVLGMRWLGPKPVAPAASTAEAVPASPSAAPSAPPSAAPSGPTDAPRAAADATGSAAPAVPGSADRPRAMHEGAPGRLPRAPSYPAAAPYPVAAPLPIPAAPPARDAFGSDRR